MRALLNSLGLTLLSAIIPALASATLALVACGTQKPPAAEQTLNIYTWADYIAPDTVANFEHDTGIQVHYTTFDTNEVLATQLLTGHTNYDIVVPSDFYFTRLMKAGAFRKLDKAALTNSVNLDPDIMQKLAVHDPGNQYSVPYLWSTTGLGYNVDKVRKRLGTAEFDSWSLLLDPQNAAKLKDCGIQIIDSPTDVYSSVLIYLGKDPNSREPADLEAAADALMKIRPFVRTIDAVATIGDLANGNVCLLLGWSGDVTQARYRAIEASNGVKIRYFVPREGGLIEADMMSIPADAPHPENAEKWMNYLMLPKVMAGITNATMYPNGNRASSAFVQDALKNDPAIYPGVDIRAKLHVLPEMTPEQTRLVTRLWTRFRTGE
jgi:putrescine transport system substrate-binding protein